MTVALIALFVSLSGVAWAASSLPRDSVKSKQIKDGAVAHKDLRADAVETDNITDETIAPEDLGFDSVGADQLADDSVDSSAILDDSVEASDILDDSIESADILDDSIEASDILDDSIESADILDDGVTVDDLADGAVGSGEIEDGSVGTDDLAEGAVGAAQLAPDAFLGELDLTIVSHPSDPTLVTGGTPENGSYRMGRATATCEPGEQVLTGYGQWEPDDLFDNGGYELFVSQVRVDQDAETVSVDGGNDSGVDHDLVAVAVCFAPSA